MGNERKGAQQDFLGGSKDVDREESITAPLRSPCKPSTSEPVTATSIFSNPSVSKCWASLSSLWASLHSELAHFSKYSPCRKIKGENNWVALQKRLLKSQVIKVYKIYLNQKPPHLFLQPSGKPPTSIQLHNVSTSPSSLVLGLTVSSSVDSSVQEKEGRSSEVGCAKKKTYRYI